MEDKKKEKQIINSQSKFLVPSRVECVRLYRRCPNDLGRDGIAKGVPMLHSLLLGFRRFPFEA